MLQEAVELKAFLLTGILGKLTPSSSLDAIVALLGAPDASDSDRSERGVMQTFVYGNLLLYFLDTTIDALEIAMRTERPSARRRANTLPDSLGVSWYQWLIGMTTPTFKQFLTTYQIPARKAIIDVPDLPDEGLSELIEIQATRMTVLFDERGIIEQIFYAPASNAHYRYEELE